MKSILKSIIMATLLVIALGGDLQCSSVKSEDKRECGSVTSTQESCENDGCCWQEVHDNGATPWCYHSATPTASPTASPTTVAPTIAAPTIASPTTATPTTPTTATPTTASPTAVPTTAVCTLQNEDKRDCGSVTSTQESCENDGCCWQEVHDNGATPWCYHSATPTASPTTAAPTTATCNLQNKNFFDYLTRRTRSAICTLLARTA